MTKSLMICSNSGKNVMLNESESTEKGYVLEGVFAQLDVLNRNNRIYTKDEYLKHLQYLRNDIRNGETLLGELDHPEDRFEVKLKEASHEVLDIWYDQQSNVIMGKIRLLDTPNGRIAKSMVDQGIPLRISSRAAGTVNPTDKKVAIQQIYTYDLVAKPGFSGAVLHRVNESEGLKYSDDVISTLYKFEKSESNDVANMLGVVCEGVSAYNMIPSVNLRKEAKDIFEGRDRKVDMNEICRPLNEDEENDTDENEDKKEEGGVEIIDVRPEVEEVEITDVKGDFSEDNGEDKESEAEETEDNEKESDDESEENQSESEETVECGCACSDKDKSCDDSVEKKATKSNILNDEAKKNIDARKERFESKIDSLIDEIKKKNECKAESAKCESLILAKYPISNCMDEGSFTEFAALDESVKSSVVAYLEDNGYGTPKAINENWRDGKGYHRAEPIWLMRAPERFKELYRNSDEATKRSIRSTASCLVFESQYDINNFWEDTGLVEAQERRMLNESFINNMPKIANESNDSDSMPYGKELIEAVTRMACEYN